MSRVFWMAVGAVGGVAAYRKGTRAVQQAKALGPLGSAQVAASATSRVAARTANGLGRLADIKAQREGRLVIGTAQDVTALPPPSVPVAVTAIDDDWVPVPERRPGPPPRTPAAAATAGPAGHVAAPATSARTAPRTTRARRG